MSHSFKATFILFILSFVLAAPCAFAQEKDGFKWRTYDREFCSKNWSYGEKAGAKDLREATLGAGDLTVDGKRNGGITVRGENRSDILVRACVQSWAETQSEADAIVKGVRVETGGTVRAEGGSDEKNFSVSYEILVPRNTNLKLTTVNGGISLVDVDGKIEFEAKNGGITLSNLAGDVRGRTQNGGINVRLDGSNWKGAGLDVETTNGGIILWMSESYAAKIETGTVNGGFLSEIPGLRVERDENDRYYTVKKRVTADLNGGGAPIRAVTTNGGVSIKAASQTRER
jgi:hypothetical protein